MIFYYFALVIWISIFPQNGVFLKEILHNYSTLKERILFVLWSEQKICKDIYIMSLGASMTYHMHGNATLEAFDTSMEVINSCIMFYISDFSDPLVEEHGVSREVNWETSCVVVKNMKAFLLLGELQYIMPFLSNQQTRIFRYALLGSSLERRIQHAIDCEHANIASYFELVLGYLLILICKVHTKFKFLPH